MVEEILLCVASPLDFNMQLYTLWIAGKTEEEAFFETRKLSSSVSVLQFPFIGPSSSRRLSIDTAELLRYEVMDQYRAFKLLEHFVSNPILLNSQSLCSISSELQSIVVEKYWSLDDKFVREILFNKRLNKSRKELEDIAEATSLNLRRVTRQYDNVKRILNAFEEACTSQWMNIYSFVAKQFKLNYNQARKYACIVFHIISKFNLTAKRRLQKVSNEDIEDCAGLIISFLAADINLFTLESMKAFAAVGDISGITLLANLRDLKIHLTGELLDSGCHAVRHKLGHLVRKLEPPGSNSYSRIRTVVKNLLQIGANLSQSREFRDLLEDILTKVVEPLEEASLSVDELNRFMVCCIAAADSIPSLSSRSEASLSMTHSRSDSTASGVHPAGPVRDSSVNLSSPSSSASLQSNLVSSAPSSSAVMAQSSIASLVHRDSSTSIPSIKSKGMK
eukprot:gene23233-31559_t